MKNLINRWICPSENQPMLPRFNRIPLTRTFVETGDERCPIAGIWSRLENDATADDSELTRPGRVESLPMAGSFLRALSSLLPIDSCESR